MTVEEKLLSYWYQKVKMKIVEKTIITLQSQKELINGEEHCLENNWEEYCIYAKFDALPPRSVEEHIYNIESLFGKYYEQLPKEEKYTLWLESEEGQDWYWEGNNKFDESFVFEDDPCFISNYTKLLMHEIHSIADNYECENITNYREYDCNGDI